MEIIRVPIKPHLKKFILTHYKLSEPVPVNVRSLLGHQIYAMLALKRKDKQSRDSYTEILELELKSPCIRDLAYRMGYVVRINHYFDKIFKDCMYAWAIGQDSIGYPPYQGLRDFLKHYGIDEGEYSFENAYRAWMRYKNESHKQKNRDLSLIAS